MICYKMSMVDGNQNKDWQSSYTGMTTTSLPVAGIKKKVEGENIIQQHNYQIIPSNKVS